MTDSDRLRAKQLLTSMRKAAISDESADRERFALISKMLLAYPIPNATAASGEARGEAYRDALSDVPASLLAEAIKRWNRGEAGEHDYRWAPAPAVLRQVCQKIAAPLLDAIADLETLLSAVSIDRAMDPTPIEADVKALPTLRRMA